MAQSDLSALATAQPAAHAVASVGPYLAEKVRSQERAMAAANRPKTLAAMVRWARHAYRDEPPFRLHTRALGEGGNPAMAPEFIAWLRTDESGLIACATDDDGYFRLPFRCAVFTMHGRDDRTEQALMADYALQLARSDVPLDEFAARVGLSPWWVVKPATEAALDKLWGMFAPLRSMR